MIFRAEHDANRPFSRHVELGLLITLFILGILLRGLRMAELYDCPALVVPDYDQTDLAIFYNHAQRLAHTARALLQLPDPPPLPPSPVTMTQKPDEGFLRPPAYPFFLAALFLLTNNALMAPIIAQAVLGVLNALLAWRLARRAGGPGTALITAAFMLFYWVLIVYEGVYHAQTLMIFLSLLFLNALEYWSQRPSLVRAGIAGLLLTLNMFAAPSSALFAPVAACWMLAWLRLSVDSWKSALKRAFPHVFTTALCATMLVAPVTLSNWRADHQFTLVSTGGGYMLMFGNHDGADGYFRPFDIKELGVNVDSNNYDEVCAVFEQVKGIKPIPAVVNRYCARYALEWIRQHPKRFLELTLKRAV
ncbi:MAG TPA: glycosyltransferase family 39 protein, partial [Candidatus Hydrogenedentes bacterium]|nr:glycosyltransferase family 39 protein [Candidatus Hydrogenedentota bacterium]